MNTKQLQYFLATAEQRSITAAAKALEIAQPAISLQIANLEHELKVKLFERDFRGMTLTETGIKFEKHAKKILMQIEMAKADVTESENECLGKVVVGLSQSVCNVLSMELLNEIEHRYENIELTFRVGPSYIVDNWLSEKKIDIALCYDDSAFLDSKANVIELIREDLFLYISEKPQNPAYSELKLYSAIPFVDLQNYEIFMPDKQDALSKLLVQTADDSGIKLKTKDAFGQMMTTLHFVTQGLGLVVCSSSSTFHLEQSKHIRGIKIVAPRLQQKVHLVKAEQIESNSAVDAIFELIREVTASVHGKNDWRGTLLDKKYYLSQVIDIETFVEG
jgi:LysR family nitrogen assimilation transcriptional regulator